MKNNYLLTIVLILCAITTTYAQNPPQTLLDPEVEVESEVEAEAEPGKVAGSVSVAAAAAANFPNAIAKISVSGGIAKGTETPANDPGSRLKTYGTSEKSKLTILDSDRATERFGINVPFILAEAEAEVESEVEVEVENGAAVAVGGSSAAAAGVGASEYSLDDGNPESIGLYPSNSITAVDAKTSTDVSLSPVNIDYPGGTIPVIDGGSAESTNRFYVNNEEESKDDRSFSKITVNKNTQALPFGIVYALETDTPLEQISTASEAESEVESEVEAETEAGAAGAAASSAVATVAVGDFAIAAADVKTVSSTSTSEVNEAEPGIFSVPEPSQNSAENTGSGNENAGRKNTGNSSHSTPSIRSRVTNPRGFNRDATSLADIPDATNGKGYSSFETDVESEVEVTVEVDNGAAAAAVSASGGGAANGQVSSAESSSSASASTSTIADNGLLVGNNGQGYSEERRNGSLLEGQSSSETEASAEATAEANGPSTNESATASADSDAFASGTISFGDMETATRNLESNPNSLTTNPSPDKGFDFYTMAQREWSDVIIANTYQINNSRDPNLSENEAEVEAEAEAVIGWNAAAAAAGVNSVQAKNGVINFEAQTSSSASTSTKVFDQVENTHRDDNSSTPATGLTYPDYGIDFSTYIYEVEAETEAEAEVGFNASAVAVSAAAAGYDDITIKTQYESHLHAAAAAAAAGETTTTSITMPAQGVAGNVTATATAEDSQNRGVSVSVAVAGVPFAAGVDNEMEAEDEAPGFATVTVTVFTDPANVTTPLLLNNFVNEPNTTPGSNVTSTPQDGAFGEVEVEAESEAEAGYGVAAAAAACGATGRGAKSEAFTIVSSAQFLGAYDFDFNALINEAITVDETLPDVTLFWNGFGYRQFIIEQLNTTTETFEQIGVVNRANEGIWEAYSFSISNLPYNIEQTFQIRPLSNASAAVQLSIILEGTLGVEVDNLDNNVSIPYPNPVSDVLYLNVKYTQNQKLNFTIYDLTGKQIDSFTKMYSGGGNSETLNWKIGNRFSNGLYILVVASETSTQSYKISVMK